MGSSKHFLHCSILILLIVVNANVRGDSDSLNYDQIDEGDCDRTYEPWPDIQLFKIAAATPRGGWMVPMSSKHFAYHLGLHLTGGHTQSEKDLSSMCIRFSQKGITAYVHGEERQGVFHCNFTRLDDVNCYSTAANSDPHEIGQFKVNLVWTDNHNYMLIVLCGVEAKQKFWALAARSPSISPEVKTKVLGFISDIGFDQEKTLQYTYDHCEEVTKHGRLG